MRGMLGQVSKIEGQVHRIWDEPSTASVLPTVPPDARRQTGDITVEWQAAAGAGRRGLLLAE